MTRFGLLVTRMRPGLCEVCKSTDALTTTVDNLLAACGPCIANASVRAEAERVRPNQLTLGELLDLERPGRR